MRQKKLVIKHMSTRKTVTFEPDADVAVQLSEADKRGRGVRTRVINQAIRDSLKDVLKRWDAFGNRRSFNSAEPQAAGFAE